MLMLRHRVNGPERDQHLSGRVDMPKGIRGRSQCSYKGCEELSRTRGWCPMHYARWRKTGDPSIVRRRHERSAEDRFFAFVTASTVTSCWLWGGYRDAFGYGMFSFEGRAVRAHIWAYKHWVGDVPDGLELDHFACDNPSCVNPTHLRPTTPRENSLRSNSLAAWFLARTHCNHGHEFTPENTRYRKGGGRICRTCASEYLRKRYRERLAAGWKRVGNEWIKP